MNLRCYVNGTILIGGVGWGCGSREEHFTIHHLQFNESAPHLRCYYHTVQPCLYVGVRRFKASSSATHTVLHIWAREARERNRLSLIN